MKQRKKERIRKIHKNSSILDDLDINWIWEIVDERFIDLLKAEKKIESFEEKACKYMKLKNNLVDSNRQNRFFLSFLGPWRAFPAKRESSRSREFPESERYSMYDHWKIADSDENAGNDMCRGNLVAHIYNHNGNVETNAKLIAAAPRMLFALQLVKEEFERRDGAGTCPDEIEEILNEFS